MRPAVPVLMRADRSISDSAFLCQQVSLGVTGLISFVSREGAGSLLPKAITGRTCLANQLEIANNIDAHLSALARRAVFYYSNS